MQFDHAERHSSSDIIASIEAAAADALMAIRSTGAASRMAIAQSLHRDVFHHGHTAELDQGVGLRSDANSEVGSGSPSDVTIVDTPAHSLAPTVEVAGSGGASADAGAQLAVVSDGGTLELSSSFSGAVAFDGATGTLKIDDSSTFSGKIAGQLAIGDVIDLADVTAGANAQISYTGNNSPGILTVSDGTHTASIELLGNYSLANFAASSDGHGGTLIVDPPLVGDGSAGAPGGGPQLAGILDGYTVRPSWEVAGVDYAVGITAGTVLKDPSTIKMAGVSVNSSLHQVTVTGGNVTLDGYDFSLAGGWSVITQAANTTISNSNFKIGSNSNFTIYGDNGSSNLTVKNCVIDGNMQSDQLNNGLIYTSTSGLTVEYTLLKNAYSDFIQAQGGGQVTIKYNVLNDNGNVNAHPDWLQTMGSNPFTETIMYNTVYQTVVSNSDGTQGFMLNDNGSTVTSAELAYNTIIALPGSNVGVMTTVNGGSSLAGTVLIHDNFADTRGGTFGNESFFSDPTYSPNAKYYNNTNMETGGLYFQNITPSPTAPVGAQTNSAKPVVTHSTLVPTVTVTSETVSGDAVTLKGQASSGSWISGYTIQIFDGATQIGLIDTDSSGAWTFTATLSAGTHSLTAKANNFFGYVSAPSQAVSAVIAGSGTSSPTPPAAPTIASFTTDSGVVGDHITNDNTLTLTGSAVAGSTVKVLDGSTVLGTVTANSSGAWTLTTAALSDGGHSLTATATTSGGTSVASTALAVTIDTHAPGVPTLVASTSAATLASTHVEVLTGTAEANSTITVFDGANKLGTAVANASGAWSYTTAALSTGGHSFTATATDAAGNTGTASSPVSVTIAAAPAAPTIASFTTDSGVVGDHITNDNTLTLTGSAVAGSTVKVLDGSTVLGTVTANSSGAWTLTTAALSDGGHSLMATATTSGGTSVASTALAVTIDTHAPGVPFEAGDSIVNGNQVVLTGTAEANSTVQVYDGATLVGTGTTNSSGNWTVTTVGLSEGAHFLTATATDVAGNVSALSQPLDPVIGAAVPATPTIASFTTDSGVVGDHTTNDNTLTLTGSAVASSTVKIFDGSSQLGTANVDGSGNWSFTTAALGDGGHILTTQDVDSSGQVSLASAPLSITIDTHAPVAPTIGAYSQTGSSVGSTTTLNDLVLKGSAEANSSVKIFDNSTQIGTATADSSGAWSFDTGVLSNGAQKFTATTTDAAGNVSAASAGLNVTVNSASSGYADGSSSAHTGTPQLASLLDSYAVRPPWQVAGVDYAVGVPAGTALKDPSVAANLPAGVSIDTANHVVSILGNNVTLDGFDFSLSGGWTVVVKPGTTGTTTIENCNFSLGANQPVAIDAGSTNVGNLTVLNCSFDGNQMNIPSVQPPPAGTGLGAAINYNGTGTFVAKYNYIHDMPADGIDLGNGTVTPTIQYNVFEGLGYTPGSHPDPIQFVGDVVNNAMIAYNTIYQPQGVEPNEGLAVQAQLGSTITNTTIANNVIIATGPNMSISLNIGLFQDSGNVLNGVIVSNNYVDPTGTFTDTGFGDLPSEVQGSNLTIENNINLLTGKKTGPTAGSFATTDVVSVVPSPSSGTEGVGTSIVFTVKFDQAMTVTGKPSLVLNDGGVATYTGGAGTNTLTFSYTVAASDTKVSALAITQFNLANGAKIANSLGDAAELTGALKTFTGLQVDPGTTSTPTPPAAPTIASFTTDSGVVGDHITNDNTLTLTGSAVAGSTVKVLDGSTVLGTVTANSSGAWTLTTAALSDGGHSLMATATTSGGTSVASTALAVTIDTHAPGVPTLVASTSAATLASTHVEVLTGTAEANSTITVFDGANKLGTAVANASGAWSYTTAALSTGGHSFTATATDAAGNTGTASSPVSVTIAAAPAAPTIASFTTDSGVVGDHITNDNTLTLTGSAVAGSTVKVLDGSTVLGTVTANSSGAWTLTTAALSDGGHSLMATATTSGGTSVASTALAVTIDTHAPGVPTLVASTSAATLASTHVEVLTGTAEANSTITVFDGANKLGTAVANASGAWSYTTAALSTGGHSFTATATDAAGNTGTASSPVSVTIAAAPAAPTIASFTTDSGVVGDHITNDNTLTLTGSAVAGSTVKVLDGSTVLGTVTANSSGAWTLTTAALSDGGHSLMATATTSGGTSVASTALAVTIDTHAPGVPTLVASTSAATLASTHVEVLTGTAEANSTITVFDGANKLGTAVANASGAWSYTTAALSTGGHSFTATATDAAGNTGTASSPVSVTIAAAPAAPTIASFTTDSGVVGDHITNDNTLTLTGSAVAGSTVKVLDGSTVLGTVTANSSGAWTLTTAALSDGGHSLMATATTSGGTSVASTALAVTIDTHAPGVPTLVASTSAATLASTHVEVLTGTAEANSTITVFDGANKLGTAVANASGAWSYTTAALSTGGHSFTATATDAAGNTGTASSPVSVTIAAAPAAPTIASFTTDSGVVGDHITNDNTLTLTGSAVAGSTVKVFEGSTQLGSANVDGSGHWSLATPTLNDGIHNLTAQDASGGPASGTFAITIDTHAPTAPTMDVASQAGTTAKASTIADDVMLKGTAEANSLIKIFDGSVQIGTSTATSTGVWSFDAGNLSAGGHDLTSTATDAAGNTSQTSATTHLEIDAQAHVEFTNLSENRWGAVTLKGTADPNSTIKLFDDTKALGSATVGSDGTWTYTTKAGFPNTVHKFTAQEVDSSGHVVANSDGAAILGTTGRNALTGTNGDDVFLGNGRIDTFVFAANFGNDVIKDFHASGWNHDVIQFNNTAFDSFASVLAHASQCGGDVVISAGSDSLTLKNTKLSALDSHDFHFG
ncbi:Ig-like domain-containing protein [Bradyrhizobium sp. USDA 3650]